MKTIEDRLEEICDSGDAEILHLQELVRAAFARLHPDVQDEILERYPFDKNKQF